MKTIYSIGVNDRGHGRKDYAVLKFIDDHTGSHAITLALDYESAAFIVRAYNNHEALVAALEAINAWMKGYGTKTQNEIHNEYVLPILINATKP